MSAVLVDTGVWYALFDPRDRVASPKDIEYLKSRIDVLSIVIPWPIAYETLRTRFVRNRLALEQFERQLKSPKIKFVDDAPYREEALTLSIESSLRRHRPLSMVDCIIRLILSDTNIRIKYLATYNAADFIDVCAKRNIELWSQ